MQFLAEGLLDLNEFTETNHTSFKFLNHQDLILIQIPYV